MRVRITAGLFADDRARRQLVDLLACIERGHIVEVDPFDAPELEAWLDGLGRLEEDYRSLLDLAIADAATAGMAAQVYVADEPASDWRREPPRLTLGDTLKLLRRPLALLVENERRDGTFLKAVLWRYAGFLDRLEEQDRLKITHGGGLQEMARLVQHHQEPQWRQRTFAVFDSDALAPEFPSAASAALGQICREAGIDFHRLRRRAAENYLPPAALLAWARSLHDKRREQHLKRARAFGRLRPEQRQHYNMKRGHHGDAGRKDRDLGRALFEGLDEAARQALDEGFGEAIGDLFIGGLEAEWLQQDDQDNEMSALFEALLTRV